MIGRRGAPSSLQESKPKGFDDYDLRLGDLMRGERATIGKSLLDVQRELKIRASYIAAIENCDVAAFETPGFIAGYVRSYARYLGMDPEWAYAKFCEESSFTVAHGMSGLASPAKPKPRQLPREPFANPSAAFVPRAQPFWSRIDPSAVGSVFVLVALIAGIGYGGWSVLREVQRVQLTPVEQAPGVFAELDPLPSIPALDSAELAAARGASTGAGSGMPAPDALDRLYRPQALELPVMVARDGPISSIDPRGSDALVTARQEATVQPGVPGMARPNEPDEPAPVQVVEDALPHVEILAVRPSWVRVQAADGTVLFEKILEAGERYEVPQTEEPARLRAGNSGSVYFVVNGATYGPSAPGAQVASNVALSAEALSERYALADLDADPELADMIAVADATSD